jgi:hypothetical protein
MQVTATITHPEFSGDSHDVIFINVLNEAQRWNVWNNWNGLILWWTERSGWTLR